VEIIQSLQSVAGPALDAVALAVTNLGSQEAYIVLLVVVYLSIDARAGRALGVGLLASFYLNQVLKQAFDTARPFVEHPELLRSEAAYRTAPGNAFPSGHAQSAATFWALAAGLGRRRWLTMVAIVLTVVIGLTRLYLGVHWPVDVLGGWAIGLAAAGVALVLARRRVSAGLGLQIAAFVVAPLALHLTVPTPESGVIAGALAGFGTAPLLYRHTPRGGWPRRTGLAVLGLAVAFAWLAASSVLLPEAVKDQALVAPARYMILAWLGLAASPWAFARWTGATERGS
jgi:membrane-associated phospholipid phosphatase